MARHIRKGDMVIVTAGNDRGATGEVLRVLVKSRRVVVQGVNVRAKHLKPTQANPQGGIVHREMPIHMSNVSPVVDGRPSRVRWETADDGSKRRVAVRGDKELHTLHGARASKAVAAPARKPKKTSRRKKAKASCEGTICRASSPAPSTSDEPRNWRARFSPLPRGQHPRSPFDPLSISAQETGARARAAFSRSSARQWTPRPGG